MLTDGKFNITVIWDVVHGKKVSKKIMLPSSEHKSDELRSLGSRRGTEQGP